MLQQLIPAIAFPPGKILQEELEARGLRSQDLAPIEPDLPQIVTDIIQGNQKITPEKALKLSKVCGTSPEFWMNLENNYQLYLARKSNSK